jgi:septal ring factor EnvC (AmiA/AmiB activator)
MLTYATYLSNARTHEIEYVKTLSGDIKASVSALEVQKSTIKENQVLLEKNKTAYTNTYASRKILLKAISKKLLEEQKELNFLETDSSRLQRLVKSLGELLYDIPAPPQELLPFNKRQGKLKLPVKGKIIHHFYERKSRRSLRWKGIVLKTKRGLDVKSIYYGRIVFSDWLNGFGNIIIIDHGGGYLSLYAYNESLEKEIGEWVVAGDVIATTGQSGGRKQNALYFEIRQNGKPVNPLKWIKKTN